jgi:uncharacterized OsmC-like protein
MAKLDSYLERKAEAMNARRADWTANPEASLITISGSSKLAGVTGARPTQMGNFVTVSDSAPGMAGHALGPTAPEMLMGALASCLVHTYVIQAVLLNIPLDHVEVEISGKLDMGGVVGLEREGMPILQDITYTARVESSASVEDIEKIHAVVEASCPILNTLKYPVDVRRTG